MARKSGRGPSGNLRNFRAMSDEKLAGVKSQVERENNDAAALAALRREYGVRVAQRHMAQPRKR